MSNVVLDKHLEALATAAKNYTLSELNNVTLTAGESYTLPTASTTTKGGVKVGTGLQMDGDTLNCTLSGGTTSNSEFVLSNVTSTVTGAIWIDSSVTSAASTDAVLLSTLPSIPNGSVWLEL